MNQALSKRVQAAMAQQPVSPPHPSADLLNAFAENALTAAERAQVGAHLAGCAECREIVFLASEANEDEVVSAPSPSPRRWRWITWAAPATAVVVVASVVLLEYPQRKEPSFHPYSAPAPVAERSTADAEAPPQPEAAKSAAVAGRAELQPGGLVGGLKGEDKKVESKPLTPPPARVPARTSVEKAFAPQIFAGTQLNSLEPKGSMSNSQSVNTLRMAPAKKAANVSGANMPVPATQFESAADRSLQADSTASNQKMKEGAAGKSARAKLDDSTDGRNTLPLEAVAAAVATPQPGPPPANARWRITWAGAVEWSSEPRVWTEALSGSPHRFRVLAVIGPDMWAGGEGGVLFHSVDHGATWTQLAFPPSSTTFRDRVDSNLAGSQGVSAIVAIHFSDLTHGELRTADGARWSTADGGQTWTLK